MDTLKGAALIATIELHTGLKPMANLRVVPAAFVVWMALLSAGVSYAADKITLICDGTVGRPSSGYGKEGPDSVVIDYDRRVVMWGGDPYPIVKSEGATITFSGKSSADRPTEGSIDRITGGFSAVETVPYVETDKEVYTNLTCMPAKPLF